MKHDPLLNKFIHLSNKAARLQTTDPAKAELLYPEMDTIWHDTCNCSGGISLHCRDVEYDLPLQLSTPYIRPLFLMETHKPISDAGADDTYAVDFDVPDKTSVFAVADGVVTAIQSNSSEGGNDPTLAGKDNYIYIYNSSENRIFCYRHIDPVPSLGMSMPVSKGMKLGVTGMTGYVITPHLHFAIYSIHHGEKYILQSIPLYLRSNHANGLEKNHPV